MAIRVRRRDQLARRRGRAGLGSALSVLAVTVLLPLATFLVAVWLRGGQLQAVQSGSMSPSYPVGALLVTEPIDASDVRRGMAVVFEDPSAQGRLVTHRVVGRAPGPALAFWTQGDANATRDPVAVPARMIRGRVRWQVTHLGTILHWMRWPRSFLLLVVVPAVLLVFSGSRAAREELRRAPAEGVAGW